jgi:hypothetical protein
MSSPCTILKDVDGRHVSIPDSEIEASHNLQAVRDFGMSAETVAELRTFYVFVFDEAPYSSLSVTNLLAKHHGEIEKLKNSVELRSGE